MVCMFLPCPCGLSGSYPSLKMATGEQEHSIPTVVVVLVIQTIEQRFHIPKAATQRRIWGANRFPLLSSWCLALLQQPPPPPGSALTLETTGMEPSICFLESKLLTVLM